MFSLCKWKLIILAAATLVFSLQEKTAKAAKFAISIETIYDFLHGKVPDFLQTVPPNQRLIFVDIIHQFTSVSNNKALFRLYKQQYRNGKKGYQNAEEEEAAKDAFVQSVTTIRENNVQYVLRRVNSLLSLDGSSDGLKIAEERQTLENFIGTLIDTTTTAASLLDIITIVNTTTTTPPLLNSTNFTGN